MPALAPITILDGASTPANHVFTPVTTSGFQAELVNRQVVPALNETLITQVRPPVSGNGTYKVRYVLRVPTAKVVEGAQVVDFIDTVDITINTNERATKQQRKNLRVLAANLLLNATVVQMVEDLEPQY